LVSTLRDDPGVVEGFVDLDVDNGHIVIQTHRIDRVVAVGPRALEPLLQEMRRRDVSLDTFPRCYSACDQILAKAGLKEPVHWHGGLVRTDKKQRIVKTSLIDGFSDRFRQKQIAEIVSRAKEIEIIIRNGP